MDIAKSRHIPTSEILEYDLLGASPLFEGDFPKKPAKHELVLELERRAPTSGTFIKDSSENTILLADFMSILRHGYLSSQFAALINYTLYLTVTWKIQLKDQNAIKEINLILWISSASH